MFNDPVFRADMGLSAVNSINWARIAAQVVYYFRAALTLGAPDQPVSFAVPSGNFGNVFAGWVAQQMGLPIEQFVVGSNHNDILARFFESGDMVAISSACCSRPLAEMRSLCAVRWRLLRRTGRIPSTPSQWSE